MRRRTLLSLPALGSLAWLWAACAPSPEEVPPVPEGASEPQRVTYGSDPSQFAELGLPAGTPRGVAVVVHGGFWRAEYGSEYAQPLVPSLLAAGWATWAVEYRRVGSGPGGGGGVPETLDDLEVAMQRLAEEDIGGPVVAIGHSAGGHLATWLASRRDLPQPLTHVVSQAGVLDLVAAHEAGLGGGAVEALLGRPPRDGDVEVDPVQQVPLEVPVWCVHGTGDDIVPLSQSESYVAAATAAGATAELVEVEGDHFAVVDPGSDAWARTLEILDSI